MDITLVVNDKMVRTTPEQLSNLVATSLRMMDLIKQLSYVGVNDLLEKRGIFFPEHVSTTADLGDALEDLGYRIE